jgi:hypothetical protein
LYVARLFPSPSWLRRYIPLKRLFVQEPHGATSQEMVFFRITGCSQKYHCEQRALTILWARERNSRFRLFSWRIEAAFHLDRMWPFAAGVQFQET